MKQTKRILLLLATFLDLSSCRQAEPKEQVKSEVFTNKLIVLMEQKNYEKLKQLTVPKLYCYLCFDTAPGTDALVDKNTFYAKHANEIFTPDLLKRLKRNEVKFLVDRAHAVGNDRDYIVEYTTYRADELAKGHEGMQFCFWLKEENNGALKLAGIEVIP